MTDKENLIDMLERGGATYIVESSCGNFVHVDLTTFYFNALDMIELIEVVPNNF